MNSRDGVSLGAGSHESSQADVNALSSGASVVVVSSTIANSISRSAVLDGIIAGGALVEVTAVAGVVAVVCVTVCSQNDVRGRPGEIPPNAMAAEQSDTRAKPPAGSKGIDETKWSGDHQGIKGAVGAGPKDNVKISPSGEVWGENADGSWTNHGPAGDFTGSGKPSRRK